MTLRSARQIEDCGEYQVYKNDQKNRSDHGRRCRTADLFGSRTCGKPFLASDAGDHNSKDNALHKSRNNVAHEKRVARRGEIGSERVIRADYSENASAENAHEVGPYREAW